MKKQHFLRLCALITLLCMQVYTLFAGDVYSLSVAKPVRMFVKTGASGHKNTFIMHNYGNIEQKNFHYKATINGKVVEESNHQHPATKQSGRLRAGFRRYTD